MKDVFPRDNETISKLLKWADDRIHAEPNPHYGAADIEILRANLGAKITPEGLGGETAFSLFTEKIIPTVRAQHASLNLAYVPAAPTPAALAFDAALGSAEIFAGTWESGSGAVFAENMALQWLAECAGFPGSAGGVFVSGGTIGNLSALHAARHKKRTQGAPSEGRMTLLCSVEAHSSVNSAANVMDAELVQLPVHPDGTIKITALEEFAADNDMSRVFALVANGGATNCGAVDDLEKLSAFCRKYDIWLHVDGAYGLAGIVSPKVRRVFRGIEHADSFIIDPHKWLFAPYDCCALVYRNPMDAAAAHAQSAVYLDAIDTNMWNPAHYAIHLSRRARGLPLWFSLVSYGTDAYAEAVETCVHTTAELADKIDACENIDLIHRSELSVILFRPKTMTDEEMDAWSKAKSKSGEALIVPTAWMGRKVLRVCIVNPLADADAIFDTLKDLR